MKGTAANPGEVKVEARNSNFDMFYEHKGEKSYLVLFMREYWSVDIQYICNIKKNKFKLENIIKLSTNVKRTREAVKNLKINTNNLKIEVKKENCTTADAKSIIFFVRAFNMYI